MYASGRMPWAVWDPDLTPGLNRARTQIEKANGNRAVLDRSHLVAHYHISEQAKTDTK
jgi:hypothetical protein